MARDSARAERSSAPAYNSPEERDAALAQSYNPSAPIVSVLGGFIPSNMLVALYVHLAEVAALYLGEDRGHERVEDHFARWQVKHFGRILEPCARMLLHQEVWRQLDYRDGGHKRPSAALYGSWADQQQWERAERAAPTYVPGQSHVARLEGICTSIGVELGPGPQAMPPAYRGLGRFAEHERREELRTQAARLPYRDDSDEVGKGTDEDTLAESEGQR